MCKCNCDNDERKLFYFVESWTSNREIFRNTRDAEKYFYELIDRKEKNVVIGRTMVKYYYKEKALSGNDTWNYEDYSDTFSNDEILNQSKGTGKLMKLIYFPFHVTLDHIKDFIKS